MLENTIVLTQIGDFVRDVENDFLSIQLGIRFHTFDKRKEGRETRMNSFLRLLGQLFAWYKLRQLVAWYKLELDSAQ